MSKIKTIKVSNLKAIELSQLNLDGATAIVTGGNNKGKTTLLRSMIDRMRKLKPELVLRQGEKDGFYELELTTGEKFKWSFDEKKEKLIFVTEKNITTSLTQEISGYYFPKTFDIDKFLEDEPAKQRAQLEKIVGIDFTDLDKKIKEAKENLSYLNKKQKEDYSRVQPFDPKLPEGIDTATVDNIEQDLRSAELHNERIKGVVYKLDLKKQSYKLGVERISMLKKEISKIEDENMQLETEIDKGDTWVKDDKNKPRDQEWILDKGKKLLEAKNRNIEIEKNKEAKRFQQIYDTTTKNFELAKADVKSLEASKVDAIANAHNLPNGFGFNDSGITYNGFEFTRQQLSLSAIYIAALKLASLGLGDVKTLYFDASALDKNSLKEINEWANENDLQLLIERPDFEGGEIEYQILEKV